jgi:EAL domain-containing protein (putative c-di-GMP-specific phosphodiesterase class I)
MSENINTYHEHLPILTEELIKNRSLSLILLDISSFNTIEEQYSIHTYTLVLQQLFALLAEQSGKDYQKEDVLALEDPEGLRILIFLSARRHAAAGSYENLRSLRVRLMNDLIPKLVRTVLPYLKVPPRIPIGFAMGIYNPLMDPHHIIMRIIREALEQARWQQKTEKMENLHKLRELIINENVITLYQPIIDLREEKPIGYEALARGNTGIIFRSPDELFGAAIKHRLLVELDRVCRKKALLFSHRLPAGSKVFINTFPATIRDPEFQGRHLVELLKLANITPDRIVIEITEKLVIDNLKLFQETMAYFTDMGMSLAIDDVGSGYSGLETIGKLKPSYLKVDMSLVKGVHINMINREMLKAISSLGRGIGAKVIAEGIEVPEELQTLQTIGIDYGQGYLLGKPDLMSNAEKK